MNQRKTGTAWLIALVVVVLFFCLGCVTVGVLGYVLFVPSRIEHAAVTRLHDDPRGEIIEVLRGTRGTLRLVGGTPVTFDPALVQDTTSAEYVDKIFVGLVSLDGDLQVRAELAETWDLSADGTVYTFLLRDNAKFQDGRPVTAEDVKYSIERSCSPATGSTVASLYLGDIVGAERRLSGQADEVVGVEVVDQWTLRISIDAPKAYFLSKLTYPTAAVVDRKNVEAGGDWTARPNGTGPFRLVSKTDRQIVLEANQHYFRGAPMIQRLEYNLRAGDPVTMYENDELDVTWVGLGSFERVTDPSNPLHAELKAMPALNVQYVGLNTELPPFDDLFVRQAFAYATPRQDIVDVMFRGSVTEARGVLPPGMPGYNESLTGLDYDADKARASLTLSKYGGPEALPAIVLASSSGSAGLAEALALTYAEILGVEIKVVQLEWSDFLHDINRRRHQMFILGWSADYPDPQNFLDIHFHSASEGNSTGYANEAVDRLLEAARVEQERARRFALYAQVEERIVQEAPWIPLFYGVNYILVKAHVVDLTITSQGMYTLENAYIQAD